MYIEVYIKVSQGEQPQPTIAIAVNFNSIVARAQDDYSTQPPR